MIDIPFTITKEQDGIASIYCLRLAGKVVREASPEEVALWRALGVSQNEAEDLGNKLSILLNATGQTGRSDDMFKDCLVNIARLKELEEAK